MMEAMHMIMTVHKHRAAAAEALRAAAAHERKKEPRAARWCRASASIRLRLAAELLRERKIPDLK